MAKKASSSRILPTGSESSAQLQQISPCVLLLNGFPGVRKLTIARQIHEHLLNTSYIDSRLLDNHVLIDPIEAIFPGRNEPHYRLRKSIRHIAFAALKELSQKNLVVILTGCFSSDTADRAVFAEHVDIACARGVPFLCVNISCCEDVNVLRLEGRATGTSSKLKDPSILRSLLEKHKLIDRGVLDGDTDKGIY